MKVAVLGPSKHALQMTRELIQLGASVRLFWRPVLDTQELIDLHQSGVLVAAPWLQVSKRFLLAGQKPATQSRFADLFRVSFQVNPEPMIEQGLTEQPDVYQKLSQEFVASLKSQLEMFEDVDVVIDASPGVGRRELGPGAPAIGESRLREGTVAYGDEQDSWSAWADQAQEIAVVGDGAQAARVLTGLKTWWQQPNKRIFHISATATPFEKFFTEDHGELSQQLAEFLAMANHEHQEAVKTWQVALSAWQELDDFIKAKKPMPEQPIPRLVVFSGHIVSAVDQLVDKTRSFLTIETSPFVTGLVQPENNGLELKTIGVDKIIGATGTRRAHEKFAGLALRLSADLKTSLDPQGKHEEVGFFTLSAETPTAGILRELQQLFSPKGSNT